jgi:hypothetical protein
MHFATTPKPEQPCALETARHAHLPELMKQAGRPRVLYTDTSRATETLPAPEGGTAQPVSGKIFLMRVVRAMEEGASLRNGH